YFEKLNGKELSYNNLVDVHAAVQLLAEFTQPVFAILKHTNVCGIAMAKNVTDSWNNALSGDPESAFGGVLITNQMITLDVAEKINELFLQVLISPHYEESALELLRSKKNRILLKQKKNIFSKKEFKNI